MSEPGGGGEFPLAINILSWSLIGCVQVTCPSLAVAESMADLVGWLLNTCTLFLLAEKLLLSSDWLITGRMTEVASSHWLSTY